VVADRGTLEVESCLDKHLSARDRARLSMAGRDVKARLNRQYSQRVHYSELSLLELIIQAMFGYSAP
jgi:hypothetical protein